MWLGRSEADTAIAHDDGRDAMVGRGDQPVLPSHLPVVMGMDVHEAGRNYKTGRIDFFCAIARHVAYKGDLAIVQRDVAPEGQSTRSVDDRAASNDQIMRHAPGFPAGSGTDVAADAHLFG